MIMRQTVDRPEAIERNSINSIKEIKQEQKKLFHLPYMQTGHKMFEINPQTQMVDAAELTDGEVNFMNPKGKVKKYIVAKPGCIYISALNETNAIKRYAKVQNAKFKK